MHCKALAHLQVVRQGRPPHALQEHRLFLFFSCLFFSFFFPFLSARLLVHDIAMLLGVVTGASVPRSSPTLIAGLCTGCLAGWHVRSTGQGVHEHFCLCSWGPSGTGTHDLQQLNTHLYPVLLMLMQRLEEQLLRCCPALCQQVLNNKARAHMTCCAHGLLCSLVY